MTEFVFRWTNYKILSFRKMRDGSCAQRIGVNSMKCFILYSKVSMKTLYCK